MSDDKLVASAGDPDEYSEGSGNPDEDWDGVDTVDKWITVRMSFQ